MANPNTIPWIHYQDLQSSDLSTQQLFDQYIQYGQFNEALVLLRNSPNLNGKSFVANAINTIVNGISFLEEKTTEGVNNYLSNLLIQQQDLINNFKNLNLYNNSQIYYPYNFVSYNNQIYMCYKQTTAGIDPTNESYWVYLGLQGEAGTPGLDVIIQGEWNNSTTYNPNDIVTYNGILYVATTQNTNSEPGTNDDWEVFIQFNKGKISVGLNEPENPIQNDIWLRTYVNPENYVNQDLVSVQGENLLIQNNRLKQYNLFEIDGNSFQNGTPSPDSPQELHSVESPIILNVKGSNVLPYPYSQSTITDNGITFTDNGDGSITINGTATAGANYILDSYSDLTGDLYLNCTYTGEVSNVSSAANVFRGVYTSIDGTKHYFYNGHTNVPNSITRLTIFLFLGKGAIANNFTIKPWINLGTEPLSYEPYSAKEYKIQLIDVDGDTHKLQSVPGYKDKIFRDSDGVWKLEKNIGQIIFNGESIGVDNVVVSQGRVNARKSISSITTSDNGLSNYFIFSNFTTNLSKDFMYITASGKLLIFGLVNDPYTTVDEFNQWLQQLNSEGNPLTVLYPLSQPQTYVLNNQAQNILNSLALVKNICSIFTGNSVHPILNITYYNNKLVGDFQYYNNFWNPLYPRTIGNYVLNNESFVNTMNSVDITINTSNWEYDSDNNYYYYNYNFDLSNSNTTLYILPQSKLNSNQLKSYNNLNLDLTNSQYIKFYSYENITYSIPITLYYQ